MPSCSALGCSNRSDKDPEKSLSFHNLTFRNEKLAEKWLDFPMHILKQKTRESNVYKVTSRHEMLGAKTRKRISKQDAVPKVPTQSAV